MGEQADHELKSLDGILSTMWRLGGCEVCGGDLHLCMDDGWKSWDCILCARSFEVEFVKKRRTEPEPTATLEDRIE